MTPSRGDLSEGDLSEGDLATPSLARAVLALGLGLTLGPAQPSGSSPAPTTSNAERIARGRVAGAPWLVRAVDAAELPLGPLPLGPLPLGAAWAGHRSAVVGVRRASRSRDWSGDSRPVLRSGDNSCGLASIVPSTSPSIASGSKACCGRLCVVAAGAALGLRSRPRGEQPAGLLGSASAAASSRIPPSSASASASSSAISAATSSPERKSISASSAATSAATSAPAAASASASRVCAAADASTAAPVSVTAGASSLGSTSAAGVFTSDTADAGLGVSSAATWSCEGCASAAAVAACEGGSFPMLTGDGSPASWAGFFCFAMHAFRSPKLVGRNLRTRLRVDACACNDKSGWKGHV